jgi:hypothetical protein
MAPPPVAAASASYLISHCHRATDMLVRLLISVVACRSGEPVLGFEKPAPVSHWCAANQARVTASLGVAVTTAPALAASVSRVISVHAC